jgi:hypothetical protein
MSATSSAPAAGSLERLRHLLAQEGGLMASLLASSAAVRDAGSAVSESRPDHAGVAGDGPRTTAKRAEYELLVEAIYEGYLLHYGDPRVMEVPEADLRLLVGDQLYAIGLARLVALGDTSAVAELADTITLSALAQGAGNGPLAEAVWAAGARAVGWGPSEEHAQAKQLVCDGDPAALEAMRTSARTAPAPR